MKRRIPWFQVFRKVVQFASLFFIVYTALSAHWRNFKVAHNSSRITGLLTNEYWGELYWRNQQVLSWFGDPLEVSDGLLGGPWAATVFGVPIVDPLAAAALMVGGHMPPTAMIVGALIPVALALVMGRVFCSFLCPARLLFEIGNGVRFSLLLVGLPLPEVEVPRLGLWVAAGTLGFSAFAGPAMFQYVLPYLSINAAITAYVFTGTISAIAVWVGFIVLVDVLYAPGQFCHSLCPTGAILTELGRPAMFVIARTDPECPPSCDLCQRACPYGLYPGERTHRPECDTCGRCVVACPQKKLSHTFTVPWKAAGMLFCFALAAAAPTAMAHHNKGLPHYGYFENYPQVPTNEFIDEVGRWEIGTVLFNFQGLQRRTSNTPDDVRFFAYVYDLKEDRGYKGPITLHLELDGERIATHSREASDEEGVYVIRQTVPSTAEYDLIYEFEVDGVVQSVPLEVYVDLDADSVPWAMIGMAGGALGLLFLISLAGRKKPTVRRSAAASEA